MPHNVQPYEKIVQWENVIDGTLVESFVIEENNHYKTYRFMTDEINYLQIWELYTTHEKKPVDVLLGRLQLYRINEYKTQINGIL